MGKAEKRYDTLAAARDWKHSANGNSVKAMNILEIFGENILTLENLKERLPQAIWKDLKSTIEEGTKLDNETSEAVAIAMKDWAAEKGATHFSHWFQPLTGLTAEKHDGFITPTSEGGAISEFSGKDLIQGEPDASSFPTGGLRQTFEARGYTAWDPTSPAFIMENKNGSYLCIPTAFASWTGEALDHKTPLLRSVDALNKQAKRALSLFGAETKRVNASVGCEQEYFLVDQEFYYRRPDLMTAGRTLVGAKPPRGQELDDHYFGSIPDRVLAFMLDAEKEMYRLGIPVKTRHNEVAPSQYEIAPVFESCNIAADHQQLLMIILKKIARKYGMECLLHEKPYDGLNGSGKHLNWSVGTGEGMNLLEPGENPHENRLFLFFFAAVLKAVFENQDLLRISVASAANDNRLGGHEAPPAIISVYIGKQMEEIIDTLRNGGASTAKQGGLLGLGTPVLPSIPKHVGDRNRTSPFAFTGNKFEFRAVGAGQSVSFPATVLNTIMADALDQMCTTLEDTMKKDISFDKSLAKLLKAVFDESHPVVFNGDGYSVDWEREAEERGLLNLPDTMSALPLLTDEKNINLFRKHSVLNQRELFSRQQIWAAQYMTTVNIEADTVEDMAKTMIYPAAIRTMNELAENIKRVGGDTGLDTSGAEAMLQKVNSGLNDLNTALIRLREEVLAEQELSTIERAKSVSEKIVPLMKDIRDAIDFLERYTADDYWPLPVYREMLFVK